MSGYWSFRESGVSIADAARSAGGLRALDLAVTQVLPVGVEFKKTTLSTAPEDILGPFGVKAVSLAKAVERAGGDDGCVARSVARQACFSSQSTLVAVDSVAAVEKDEANANLVTLDEAVDTVQRKWWEALEVDVRPAPFLSWASESPLMVGTPDAETLNFARELLSHSTKRRDEEEAVRLHDSSTAGCEARPGEGRGQRACVKPPSGAQVERAFRKHAKHTLSRSCRLTVPRGPSLHTEKLARLRGSHSSAVSVQSAEGEASQSHVSGCIHQDQGKSEKSTRVISYPSSRSNGQRTAERDGSFPPDKVIPFEARDEDFSPSEALLGALRTHSNDVVLSSNAERRVEAMQRREELVILRRYFTSWLTAAGQRHIQKRVASYHCFLMECVRDTMGTTTSRVVEGEATGSYTQTASDFGLVSHRGEGNS